jgi:subfamily B ATP-binding cassette protein MsbA
MMAFISQSVIRDIRDELYSHIQKQSLAFFGRNPTGKLMSRITYDVTLVNAAITDAAASLLRDSFTLVALIAVIFYRNWQLAAIAILVYPLAMYPIIRFGKKLRKVGTRSQETMGYINAFLHETISGARVVKAFGMEGYETGRFADANREFFRLMMKSCKVRALSRPTMEILTALGIAAIIWHGGKNVIDGTMTTGEFFSFMTALFLLYKPIKKLNEVNNKIQEGLAAAVRVFDILDTRPDIRSKEGALEVDNFTKSIELKDVKFNYGEKDVLCGFSMCIKKGERIALVGSSGVGKSTISNLIPRFYDVTEGSISIDGHDIRDLRVESLRSLMGIVTQETILFDDTVRNNIAYGHKDMPEEKIMEAAKAAFAHDFIKELPQGYDTEIGERGFNLSGGQRQRLSIARAILKNAPILILDEATSALDPESEKLVQEALNNLMKDRTSIVIAHRLPTIRDADRIIAMSEGLIAEEGTHEELLAKNGLYSALWNRQFQDIEAPQ